MSDKHLEDTVLIPASHSAVGIIGQLQEWKSASRRDTARKSYPRANLHTSTAPFYYVGYCYVVGLLRRIFTLSETQPTITDKAI